MTASPQSQSVVANLSAVMDAIVHIVEQETLLVRAGKLAEASRLEVTKTDLANRYYAGAAKVNQMRSQLSDDESNALADLQRKHGEFHAALQMNLTVLATAHAVSEGIVRGVWGELVRKSSPSTYSAEGRPNGPSANASQPLSVSRVL